MVSRGHCSKKKKNTVNSQTREESKDSRVDEAMDGQANIIRNERPEEWAARAAFFTNPFT